MAYTDRVVITGVGLAAPNGNTPEEFRRALLTGVSGITRIEVRFMGPVLAGVCRFDERKYQGAKERRRGTRAGATAIYCCHEALQRAGLPRERLHADRVGVFLGITEHGTVETENEIDVIRQHDYDTRCWSHHHNPRTVANNPAGEVTLNLKLHGPHYTIGAACAAGNAGLIQGVQMLRLGEVDVALGGGVSEATGSFGIFASFASEGALAEHEDPTKASRPFDLKRNGIVVSEGGCVFVLERLEDALRRGASIVAEVAGYAMNSDAADPVVPEPGTVAACMRLALERAGMEPKDIDIINTHATATPVGDEQEVIAINEVFGDCETVYVNNTKSFIGHAMGAAGALELAGNLGAYEDGLVHPTINLTELDPKCAMRNLVIDRPQRLAEVDYILNNSFGMLGTNSAVITRRYRG
ncbi:MAG TPA: beta-ketoacyl-[acyl-carrier-protein] synthase family protein [Phycisphaerae bacterium]|nr:beta-ketoacyl-[acyl-carrier-protein] synthase family protein [Phycisphaerae bacterium]HNU45974.1 beta-ketoacyl-[acyl-carrier-protein] synthase family protein [Phycisphaerae bacterium]